jgi:sugar lactone lactonase YvrE
VPTANGSPEGITTGPDGNLWFTELNGDKIGRLTPSGTVSEFAVPTSGSGPDGITTGPDGNLWFTELNGDKIGRVTPSGTVSEFAVPTAGSGPDGITTGPDGNLWFTELNGDKIGRVTPSGTFSELAVPTAGSGPSGITTGPDGNLWFTELNGDKVGRVTPSGTVTEFAVPTAGSGPDGITAGPDGNVWFTESYGSNIGRVTPSGTVTEYPVPAGPDLPGITTGPDGNLWFTEYHGNWVGTAAMTPPSALDAVSVLVGTDATTGASSGGLAPGTPAMLTLQEAANIYDCTWTNWDQVQVGVEPSGTAIMGANDPIVRYWPWSGSGTLTFFQNILSSLSVPGAYGTSFNPLDYGTAQGCANNLTGTYITGQNAENQIVTDGNHARAIYIYSVDQFAQQWNDTTDYGTRQKNFDPSLTIAALGNLGALTGGTAPYTYADTNGNIDYPFDPYMVWDFNKSVGRVLYTGAGEIAEGYLNPVVANGHNEWYTEYGTTSFLEPGVGYENA